MGRNENRQRATVQVHHKGMKAKVELHVSDMTCQGCVRSIETKLCGLDGVSYAHVNLGQSTVTVEYDDERTDAGQLVGAVEQIGFQAAQS
jgi:copper chaperone CopZ